jgi:hypothetical protein
LNINHPKPLFEKEGLSQFLSIVPLFFEEGD